MALVKLIPILIFLSPVAVLFGQEKPTERQMNHSEFIDGMTLLMRLGASKPFLTDSQDVYLEPQSLNQFFTDRIYQRLEGNAYFGYRWDEGFNCKNREVSIEEIKDLTETAGAAYRLALEQALRGAGYEIKPQAACQIGLCIVGIEAAETKNTLAGVMVEAYLRNASTKKSFFIRHGAGSPRSLAGAIQLSAEMLVGELEDRRAK